MFLVSYIGYLKDGSSYIYNNYTSTYSSIGKDELHIMAANLCRNFNYESVAFLNIQKLPIE
jgi:hypothetical protein